MPKTSFSKSQLMIIEDILYKEKMFPVDKIRIAYDPLNSSSKQNYYLIGIIKGDHIIKIGFITKNLAKIAKLEEQLNIIFKGDHHA